MTTLQASFSGPGPSNGRTHWEAKVYYEQNELLTELSEHIIQINLTHTHTMLRVINKTYLVAYVIEND